MNHLSVRQLRKSIARTMRTLGTALLVASLLGLISPPLIEVAATQTADLTGFENLSGLAEEVAAELVEALPETAVAEAAPLDALLSRN